MSLQINVDAGTMPDLIHILIRDENVFNQIKADFPDILADLTTLKTNPNCSCRGKVGKYFQDKVLTNANLLEKYYTNKQAIAAELESIKVKRQESIMGGKIFKVGLGEEAWKEFNRQMTGKVYRGFSVVREFDYLLVYFL